MSHLSVTKELNGHYFRGKYSLDENIADLTGLRAAYRAFMRKPQSGNGVFGVSGYEKYTPEQAFFIAYGTASFVNRTSFNLYLSVGVRLHLTLIINSINRANTQFVSSEQMKF